MDAGKLLGRGMHFPPRVGADGRVAWSEGEDNVRESIQIILVTARRERILAPEFGASLRAALFEPNTVATRQRLQDEIGKALARWEPRISVDSVAVDADPDDSQSAIATITYRLVATRAGGRVSLKVALSA